MRKCENNINLFNIINIKKEVGKQIIKSCFHRYKFVFDINNAHI